MSWARCFEKFQFTNTIKISPTSIYKCSYSDDHHLLFSTSLKSNSTYIHTWTYYLISHSQMLWEFKRKTIRKKSNNRNKWAGFVICEFYTFGMYIYMYIYLYIPILFNSAILSLHSECYTFGLSIEISVGRRKKYMCINFP